ncbi:MAG: T9SS type A sorting domain-containing protein [Bacteroidales bacterium]
MLMDELKDLGPLPVTHIVDFNESYNWYYFGNRYFRGNEYLYTLLTRYTKGNYFQFNYWDDNISGIMEPVFQSAGGVLSSYDVHTDLEDGFCFSRYDIEENENVIFLDKPMVQIGSYNGSFPFVVEMAGMYKGEPVSLSRSISRENAFVSDSLLKKMWAGNYIARMEKTWTWDNELISQIIDMSLKNRVLSNYTAFLALEPGMDTLFNEDPGNGSSSGSSNNDLSEGVSNGGDKYTTGINGTREEVLAMIRDSIRAKVYPNPFHNHTRIELSLGNFQVRGSVQMVVSVYDVTGKKVAGFNPENLLFNGQMSVDWDGRDSNGIELPRGIYYFSVKTSTFNKVVRLIKL